MKLTDHLKKIKDARIEQLFVHETSSKIETKKPRTEFELHEIYLCLLVI
jgi:hypothetical protein